MPDQPIAFQTNLRDAKASVRAFIRAHWSDQKVFEVFCFNKDGKMNYNHPCKCIRGVTFSDTLHEDHCHSGTLSNHHYMSAGLLAGACEAEDGYRILGACSAGVNIYSFKMAFPGFYTDTLRQRRMGAILKAEIKRRAGLAEKKATRLDQDVTKNAAYV